MGINFISKVGHQKCNFCSKCKYLSSDADTLVPRPSFITIIFNMLCNNAEVIPATCKAGSVAYWDHGQIRANFLHSSIHVSCVMIYSFWLTRKWFPSWPVHVRKLYANGATREMSVNLPFILKVMFQTTISRVGVQIFRPSQTSHQHVATCFSTLYMVPVEFGRNGKLLDRRFDRPKLSEKSAILS